MNYKVYNPKPFGECTEGLYKPGYSLYFTTWTRDIRMGGSAASQIGEEIISYLHTVPQSREIDLYLGYVRLHTYPYSKEQLDSLVGYIGTNKVKLGKLNYFITVDVWGFPQGSGTELPRTPHPSPGGYRSSPVVAG